MLREKINNKEKMIGTHTYLTDVTVAKIIGMAGYDYIWVDLEHSYKSIENVLADKKPRTDVLWKFIKRSKSLLSGG